MNHWNKLSRLQRNYVEVADYQEPTPPGLRKRLKGRPKLSLEEKVDIAHQVFVGHELQGDVAKSFRISQSRVCQICRHVRRKQDALQVMRQDEEGKADRRAMIKRTIMQLIAHTDFLGSADQVRWYLFQLYHLKFSRHEVNRILKQDLGMRYKRLVHVAPQANTTRNLVLRQQFALVFLRLAEEGKDFINVDET